MLACSLQPCRRVKWALGPYYLWSKTIVFYLHTSHILFGTCSNQPLAIVFSVSPKSTSRGMQPLWPVTSIRTATGSHHLSRVMGNKGLVGGQGAHLHTQQVQSVWHKVFVQTLNLCTKGETRTCKVRIVEIYLIASVILWFTESAVTARLLKKKAKFISQGMSKNEESTIFLLSFCTSKWKNMFVSQGENKISISSDLKSKY